MPASSGHLHSYRERTRSKRTTVSDLFGTHRFDPDAVSIDVAESFPSPLRAVTFEIAIQRQDASSSGIVFELSDELTGGLAVALDDEDLVVAAGRLAASDDGADSTIAAAVPAVASKATGTLTLTGNASAGQTVSIDGVVYTWRAVLATAYEVLIGASASDSLDNLIAAINGAAGEGTTYGTGTVAHPRVTAAAGTGDTMDVTAASFGVGGNSIATSETMVAGSWGATTLSGGLDAITRIAVAVIPGLGLLNVWVNGQRAGSAVSVNGSFGAGGWATAAGTGAVADADGTVTDRIPAPLQVALTGAAVVSPLRAYDNQRPKDILFSGLGTDGGSGSWSNTFDPQVA